MTRWSLRTRMILLSSVAALLALALAGWTMAGVLERVVVQGVDRRLEAQLAVLASAVDDDGTVNRARLAARRAILAAGPGWRWRIAGPRGSIGSGDLPDLRPAPLPPPPPGHAPPPGAQPPLAALEGQDAQGRVHARQARIATAAGTVTITAAAPGAVIARPIRDALVPLFSVIVALAAIFALAAWMQLRLALRPLAALGAQVAAIREGRRDAVEEDQPAELRPLASELNALAAANATTLATARQSAANLAHALKTPVATLSLTLAPDDPAAQQVRRIEGVIRHHLARARANAVHQRANTVLAPVVADLAAVIGALHPAIAISIAVDAALRVAIDAHDLAEILGNLLDNAARHARSRLAIVADPPARGMIRVTIDDDGPGIPPERRAAAVQPGVRLDEGPAGDGFGLAIASELAGLYGGAVVLAESPLGGLRVAITCPARTAG